MRFFDSTPNRMIALALLAIAIPAVQAGCTRSSAGTGNDRQPRAVWGRRGISDGRLQKPRAMAIDRNDEIYIVDMTGRIQVFDTAGKYLRGWRTPQIEHGKPTGLSFDRQGHLMVADTHYFRTLFYTTSGDLLDELTIGGTYGHGPGEFGFVTDAVEDSNGNYYIAEYGEYDRIQKFTAQGAFLFQWGAHGSELGQFMRPQGLAIDQQDHLWIADACNHRIQAYDATQQPPQLIRCWGTQGTAVGQLSYPYDLILDDHSHLYVCEFGNQRVQKFTLAGKSLGCWGRPGRRPGELSRPWAIVMDSHQHLYILDTYNHRVQSIDL